MKALIRSAVDRYEIKAPVPGFKPEEVEITFSDGVLKVQAQHREESRQEQAGYLRKEIALGNFYRSIQMPGDVNEDDITAGFEDGMLTVTVPKMPRPQPKKIKISGMSQKQLTGKAS